MKYETTAQVKNGKAYIHPPALSGGKYYISAYYHPNSKYRGSYKEYTYYINQTAATGIMDTEIRTYFNGEYITPIAHFSKEGTPLQQAEVEFYLGNQFIGRYWTDENGMAIAPPYQILIEPGQHRLQAKLLDGKDFVGTVITSTLIIEKATSDLELTASSEVYREQNVIITGTINLSPKIIDEEASLELKYTRNYTNGDTEQVILTQSINPVETDTFSFTVPIFKEETPGYKYATVKLHSSNYHYTSEESVSFIVKVTPYITIVPEINIGNEYYLYKGNIYDEYGEAYYPPNGEIETYLINTENPLEYSSYMIELNGTLFMPYLFDWDAEEHSFRFALIDSEGTLFDFSQFTGITEDEDWCDEFGNSLGIYADPLPEDIDYIETSSLTESMLNRFPFRWNGNFSLENPNPPGEDGSTMIYDVKFIPDPDVSIVEFYECRDPWAYFKGIALTLYDKYGQEMRIEWNLGDMLNTVPTMVNQRQINTVPIDIDGSFTYLQKPQPLLGNHQTRAWSLNESSFCQDVITTTNINYIHSNHFKYEPPLKITIREEDTVLTMPVTIVDNYSNVKSGMTVRLYQGETLLDSKVTNEYGKANLQINCDQYEGKINFDIKTNDTTLDEEFQSSFSTYFLQEHYFEITTATTTLDEYNKLNLNLQLYLEGVTSVGSHNLYLEKNGSKTKIAENFIRFNSQQELVQNYTINLPTSVMNAPNYTLSLEFDEYLTTTKAYPASVATKSLKMIEATSIQNTELDTQTITSNLNYNIAADNQDHTITYIVSNPLTNELVNEGYVSVTSQLVDTVGTIPTRIAVGASEDTVAANSYVSLYFQLFDYNDHPLSEQDLNVYEGDTLLGTVTTNINGRASRNVLVNSNSSSVQYTVQYMGDYMYDDCSSNIIINIAQPVVDPFLGWYQLSNWKYYDNITAGTAPLNQNTVTSSQLTVNSTTQTVTDLQNKYYVYNKTLDEFLTYFNNEFTVITYKTGGDGRFDLGFVNMTNGYKLGYLCNSGSCNMGSEENNDITASAEVTYQKYNEFKFKKEGNNLTMYYYATSNVYKVKTISLANINTNNYYFYFKSYNRAGLTITKDDSKIEYYSTQQ